MRLGSRTAVEVVLLLTHFPYVGRLDWLSVFRVCGWMAGLVRKPGVSIVAAHFLPPLVREGELICGWNELFVAVVVASVAWMN